MGVLHFSKYVEVIHSVRSFIYAFACAFGIAVDETNDASRTRSETRNIVRVTPLVPSGPFSVEHR